jgi:hypothetical protein
VAETMVSKIVGFPTHQTGCKPQAISICHLPSTICRLPLMTYLPGSLSDHQLIMRGWPSDISQKLRDNAGSTKYGFRTMTLTYGVMVDN